ncbi:MAG: hypothetical protein ABSH49_17040 [Bryobacteraceae bacterium]|jgi:hypothetical protein
MGDLADRFGGQRESLRNLRSGHAASQLLERQRAQDDAHLLNAPSQ